MEVSDKECLICAGIFDNTSNGKEFFEFLREQLILPVADPKLNSNYAFFNEGKNEFIRVLFSAAEKGRDIKYSLID